MWFGVAVVFKNEFYVKTKNTLPRRTRQPQTYVLVERDCIATLILLVFVGKHPLSI